MSVNSPTPPLCMQINIINPFTYNGIQNQYSCTLICTPQTFMGGSNFYDCRDIRVGNWVSNYPGGQAWEVIEIVNVDVNVNSVDVIICDKEYYNYSIDPDIGEHGPNDGSLGYVWSLADNGLPNLFPIYGDVSKTYVSDLVSRFNSRNYFTSYISVFQVGNNFQQGQFLFIYFYYFFVNDCMSCQFFIHFFRFL